MRPQAIKRRVDAMEAGQFDGKVVLITGAGGGLGTVMSKLLASRGAAIAAADIDIDRAEQTASAIRQAGGKAVAVRADVTIEADVEAMVAQTVAALGGLDVLVNNAGNSDPKLSQGDSMGITNLSGEVWDKFNAINGRGGMFGCKYAIPEMLKRGGGSIVNIVSVAGLKGGHALAAYGASKAALVSLTRYVAVAYGKQNIRCNAIAPGTCVHDRMKSRIDRSVLETSGVLGNRLGNPDDIAYAVAFLASDEAGYITGQVLAVDGGGTVGQITAKPYVPGQQAAE
jgi:NAD(P)-dependent dehydrogenase (short-subunit alcohol dehydrogenase family)